jgi:hypothetical protein
MSRYASKSLGLEFTSNPTLPKGEGGRWCEVEKEEKKKKKVKQKKLQKKKQ